MNNFKTNNLQIKYYTKVQVKSSEHDTGKISVLRPDEIAYYCLMSKTLPGS